MGNKFQQIDQASVLSWNNCTIKASRLISYLCDYLGNKGWINLSDNLYSADSGRIPDTNKNLLFIEGMSCEILQPGQNWQKGKVKMKISFEFQPDEPELEVVENSHSESSLDDIRRKLNQAN